MTTTKELICWVEENFTCQVGDQRASHHFEMLNTCIPYVVYAGIGASEGKVTTWLLESVFKPILALGGKRLVWRSEEKIGCRQSTDDEETIYDRSFYRIYTRLLVVRDDGIPVKLDDYIKVEGMLTREIAA